VVQAGADWDDPAPLSISQRWAIFNADLGNLASISIPRWLDTRSTSSRLQLHGFSDASHEAVAAVIYARVHDDDNDRGGCAKVSLLAAKSRVAPLKKQTIPCLELSAAVLLVRLLARIRAVLHIPDTSVHLWTDSTVSLSWIQGQPTQWKEFVANRVAVIQELAPDAQWHHIAGTENPADCASQGLLPHALADHSLWWYGPDWLSQPATLWPADVPRSDVAAQIESRKDVKGLTVGMTQTQEWSLLRRFSSLNRLLRITAWIRRAINRFQRISLSWTNADLCSQELFSARQFWVQQVQHDHFAQEIADLKKGRELFRSHHLLKFAPFLDSTEIL